MRQNGFILWIVLAAALLVVLNLPVAVTRQVKAAFREGIAPLQSLVSGIGGRGREWGESVRGLGRMARENEKMAAELLRLRNEVRDLKALEEENLVLREHLEFSRRSRQRLVDSEVIGRDISGWWQTIRLGKGSAEDIERNMAVETVDGLVGRTIEVSARTTDVLLISDPSCRVSARLSRTGAFGIVSGRGPSSGGRVVCRMEFINKDVPIRPGDEVVTSGLGGIFPKGLLIGFVERVFIDASGLYQYADVIPRADLGRLSHVFVVAEVEDPIDEMLRKRGRVGEGNL